MSVTFLSREEPFGKIESDCVVFGNFRNVLVVHNSTYSRRSSISSVTLALSIGVE